MLDNILLMSLESLESPQELAVDARCKFIGYYTILIIKKIRVRSTKKQKQFLLLLILIISYLDLQCNDLIDLLIAIEFFFLCLRYARIQETSNE